MVQAAFSRVREFQSEAELFSVRSRLVDELRLVLELAEAQEAERIYDPHSQLDLVLERIECLRNVRPINVRVGQLDLHSHELGVFRRGRILAVGVGEDFEIVKAVPASAHQQLAILSNALVVRVQMEADDLLYFERGA